MKQRTILLILFLCILSISTYKTNAQVIFEAEDAFISAGFVDTKHPGYTGDGFADTENTLDVFVEWTIHSLKEYNDSIGFRYALGKPEHRTMQVFINDELTDTIDFDNTTEFTNYIYKYTIGTLVAGMNTIKLVAINVEGAPNLDHMLVKLDTNAYFEINLSIEGDGTVPIIPEADSFQYGTRITLSPEAAIGSEFSRWSGDIFGETNPLSFTVDKDYSIQAHFRNTLAAFPGAEGFGKNITGGRGGMVLEVTNLNDDGAGSLRAALNLNEKRTIVFQVSGNINLTSDLVIRNGNVTIAGQTAPGDGITLSGHPLKVKADNVIIRFIRSRLGDVLLVQDDAMNGTENFQGIIIDHCTMSWSVDEVSSFYDNSNFTMQYCLLSEALYKSVHDKGAHSYGGIWGGKGASFHHNLLAHNNSRNPRFCGSRYSNKPELEKIDFRNNVIFNWGGNSVYGAEGGSYNLINNYYKYGPATSSSRRSRIIAPNADDGSNSQPAGVWGTFYVDGNYVNGYPAVTENNWAGVHASISDINDIKSEVEFECDSVTTQPAEIAFEHVLAQAGVCFPQRDIVDKRIIQEALKGVATFGASYGEGKGIIDSQTDVGGWPVLESTPAPVDSDHDGMPDEWETARGLNPNDPEDRNGDDNGNGYTNLEEYLNELVGQYTYIIRPLHFAVSSYDKAEITLVWDDVVEDETAFLLERKTNDEEYTQIAEIPANATSYIDASGLDGTICYRLRAMNETDTSYYTDTVFVEIPVGLSDNNLPSAGIKLFPNPFSEEVTVNFNLESSQDIKITLIDMNGSPARLLYNSRLESGSHQMNWNLDALPTGIYCFSIETNDTVFLNKLIKH